LRAREGILKLYFNGINIDKISKLLSVGVLGRKRRLVPTRWAIIATDKIISDFIIYKIKNNETIDKIEVYLLEHKRNLFLAILFPEKWSFEGLNHFSR
jgi:hypothetical protein